MATTSARCEAGSSRNVAALPHSAPAVAWSRRAASIATAAVLLDGGCTQVVIHATDDATRTEWHAGIVNLDLGAPQRVQLIEATSLGFAQTIDGLVVGYHDARLAVVPESCALVVWVSSDAQLATLDDLLASRSDICTSHSD